MEFEDRGVVDQRVQAPIIADDLLDQIARLLGVGDVGPDDRVRIALEQSDCLFGLLAVVVVMNDHSRAVFGEPSRGGASNALRRAGDEYDFVFEIHLSSPAPKRQWADRIDRAGLATLIQS